jgi:phenylacetic acid degradation operon negative regulatory protein
MRRPPTPDPSPRGGGEQISATAQPSARLRALIEHLRPRAAPLIITVFGDAIAPRGGNIWLGSLIGLMAPLGLSDRLVRTGVYRLARDNWLSSRSVGRRSYYAITPSARTAFAEAEKRIYASTAPRWDGSWLLVQMLPGLAPGPRKSLRSTLGWLGFGQLSPKLLVRPGGDDAAIAKPIKDALATGLVSVFRARLAPLGTAADARSTAAAAWDFGHLNEAYGAFVAAFRGFERSPPTNPLDAFVLRTLLVHEYRRVLLKDPELAPDLLPENWAGASARGLAGRLYFTLRDPADRFIAASMERWEGSVPEPGEDYFSRFAPTSATSAQHDEVR